MPVTLKSNLLSRWLPKTIRENRSASLEMATDILRRSVMIAPVDKRLLVNSGRIEPLGTTGYSVLFGGGRVPYAKRRHYENLKNPQTLRYLQRGGDSVRRERVSKYLRMNRIGSSVTRMAL